MYADQLDQMETLVAATLGEMFQVPDIVLSLAKSRMENYFFLTDSTNELCRNHSDLLYNAFLEKEIWALKSK